MHLSKTTIMYLALGMRRRLLVRAQGLAFTVTEKQSNWEFDLVTELNFCPNSGFFFNTARQKN